MESQEVDFIGTTQPVEARSGESEKERAVVLGTMTRETGEGCFG